MSDRAHSIGDFIELLYIQSREVAQEANILNWEGNRIYKDILNLYTRDGRGIYRPAVPLEIRKAH
jgi:hypothetical protein